MHMNKIPLSLLFSRQLFHPISIPSYKRYSRPFTIFRCWTCSLLCPCLCCTMEPKTGSSPSCQHSYWCTQWDCWSWQCGHVAGSWSACYPTGTLGPLCTANFQPVRLQNELSTGLHISLHEVPIYPILYFAEVSLNGGISICCISYSSHICIISELSEDALLIHFLSPGVYHWWLGSSWELRPTFQFTLLPIHVIQFIYLN